MKFKVVTIFKPEVNEIKIPQGCQKMIYDLGGNDFCRCGFVGSSTGILDNPEQESAYLCNECVELFAKSTDEVKDGRE